MPIDDLVNAITALSGVITAFVQASIQSLFDTLYSVIINTVLPAIFSIAGTVINTLQPYISLIIDQAVDELIGYINIALSAVEDALSFVLNEVWVLLQSVSAVIDIIESYAIQIYDFLINLPQMIIDALLDVLKLILALSTNLINSLTASLSVISTICIQSSITGTQVAVSLVQAAEKIVEAGMDSLSRLITSTFATANDMVQQLGVTVNIILESWIRQVNELGGQLGTFVERTTRRVLSDIANTRLLLSGVATVGAFAAYQASTTMTT